jgi:hypothetical protein
VTGDRGARWRRIRRIGALATLLAFAAPAGALATYGSISGTVTEEKGGAPIQGISACAFALNGELLSEAEKEHAIGCAETDSAGAYTVSELVPESYAVYFSVGPSSSLNFLPRLYDEKSPTAEPTPVAVTAGATTPNIDAKLVPGGRISGRITSAATGAPLEHAVAFAFTSGSESEIGGIARANSNGEYAIGGLSSGTYAVLFIARGYAVQYYEHKLTRTEATPVTVTIPETTPNVDAAMTPAAEPMPGTEGPLAGPIPGTAGSSSPGGSPAPRLARPEGTLALLKRRIRVRTAGRVVIELGCAGRASCRAKVTLRARRRVRVKGRELTVSVVLGTSSVLSISGASRRAVSVPLNGAGRRLLREGDSVLHADLQIVTPGRTRDERVVLSASGARSAASDPRFTG